MTRPAAIEIVEPGVLTTVQDLGRPGLAAIGVPHSGAVDPALAAHINRLVGNTDDAAVIESVGGLVVRAVTPSVVATDLEPVARTLQPGQTIRVAVGTRQWHYLAVRGGVDVAPVLGSRSTDTLSGVGPPPIRVGDRMAVGEEPATPVVGELWPVKDPAGAITITDGPRADWFSDEARRLLVSRPWTVADASRVGIRLAGVSLERALDGELPSEGLVRGAIQVPPDGQPIMMLADHPTTGGYPVIAVVDPADVAKLAQHLIGTPITFRRSP